MTAVSCAKGAFESSAIARLRASARDIAGYWPSETLVRFFPLITIHVFRLLPTRMPNEGRRASRCSPSGKFLMLRSVSPGTELARESIALR
jgi:hypothetical protein